MHRYGVSALVLTFTFAAIAAACSGTETQPPPDPAGSGGSGGGVSTGGAGGEGQGAGGADGGSGGVAGQGGGVPSMCGNGVLELHEECDGADLGGATCAGLGLGDGPVVCNGDCTLDSSACSLAEQCQDGVDNDGDGLLDCADPTCDVACSGACAAPLLAAGIAAGDGSTLGHPDSLAASCAPESGSDVAVEFTTFLTGVVEAYVGEADATPMSVSIRTGCSDPGTEVACSNDHILGQTASKRTRLPVTAGDKVFVIFDVAQAGASGLFTYSIENREILCGDGLRDPGETCDDGNAAGADGCGATCAVELSESEPNNTLMTADPVTPSWVGQVSPAGDVDVVSVVLGAPGTLVADVDAIDLAGCAAGQMDSSVEILSAGGAVLAQNDDFQPGSFCSRAVATGLAAGTYHVRVSGVAGAPAEAQTFPYRLVATSPVCGNGAPEPTEECDDGDTMSGDGCSAQCLLEVDETEPNDTPAQSNPVAPGWVARISPDNDVDVFSVNVAGGATITATTSDPTGGDACLSTLDSFIEIVDADGTTVLVQNDDFIGHCSSVTVSGLDAGKYYVRVRATPVLDVDFVYLFPYALEVNVE